MRSVLQDLRYAVRVLAKKPGFSVIAILTLALGIGANAAIFSVVYGILLRPLPYPEPQQLMAVQWGRGATIAHNDLTGVEVKFLQEQLRQQRSGAVESMAVKTDFAPVNLIFGGSAQSVPSLKVSSRYFHVLGVQPQIGNGLGPEQDQPGAPAEVVLSHSLWVNAFAENPNVLGRTIDVNGQEYTVTGVMPSTFESYPAAAVYLPFHLNELDENYVGTNYTTIVRVKSGSTRDQAQAQMEGLSTEFRREYANMDSHRGKFGFLLTDYRESLMQRSETSARDLFILQIAVGFVLLIACTNLASLLFARGSGRSHEISVRIALGASRSRILRMLLIEDLLLACAGGVIALLLSLAAVPLLIAASPVELPRTSDIHVSGAVVLFTLGAVIVATLLFGIAPALRLFLQNRTNLVEGAKSVTASRGQALAGRVLMVAQTSIALVLLAGATLMFRSFLKMVAVPPGFATQRLLTFQVPLTDSRYQTVAKTEQFADSVVAKLKTLPGVEAASYVNTMPFVRGVNDYVVPHARKDIQVNFATEVRAVTPGYFRTLRSPILEGHGISESDTATSSPVVVINKTLADLWWPKQNPVGESVDTGGRAKQVIGVSADLHESSLDQAPSPMIVVPLTQVGDHSIAYINRLFPASFLIHTKTNVDLAKRIREVVHSVDPELPVENIRPMEEVIDVTLAGPRFFGSLFGAFAGFALLLTAIGIYGLLSYLVNQKVREIGVRMALGASRRQVLEVFLRQALLISSLGIVIGVLGAIGLTRFLRAFLFEVRPSDPAALVLAAVLLAITALVAAFVPALRATRVNPVVALRYE
ncbi:MAG TPA: ABC transporter permease [Terriglobales bacterium]|nr:ABC transporter permease [Terriglobales bacterium]